MSFDAGDILGDRFRITGFINSGGMADVYKAVDLDHDKRPAAVKVMKARLADSPEFRGRFKREARLPNRYIHPNILPIWASGNDQNVFYIATPLADYDLAGLIEQRTQLDLDEALNILRQVAWALDHAAEQGVIHRDVKPENILLIRNPRGIPHAYLSDFGIARSAQDASLTQTGSSLRTPHYAAPEQIRGDRDLDRRVDQYALACTLYVALTGSAPFTGDTNSVEQAHLKSEPPPLSARRADLPAALDAAAARALAKDSAQRYDTCQELIEACQAAATPAATIIEPRPETDDLPPLDDEHAAETEWDEPATERQPVIPTPVPPPRRFGRVLLPLLLIAGAGAGALLLASRTDEGPDRRRPFDGPGSAAQDRKAEATLLAATGPGKGHCRRPLVAADAVTPAGNTARLRCAWSTDLGGRSATEYWQFDTREHLQATYSDLAADGRLGRPASESSQSATSRQSCPSKQTGDYQVWAAGDVNGRRFCVAAAGGQRRQVIWRVPDARMLAFTAAPGPAPLAWQPVWEAFNADFWAVVLHTKPKLASTAEQRLDKMLSGAAPDSEQLACSLARRQILDTTAELPDPAAVSARECRAPAGFVRRFQLFVAQSDQADMNHAYDRFVSTGSFLVGGSPPTTIKPIPCYPSDDNGAEERTWHYQDTPNHDEGKLRCLLRSNGRRYLIMTYTAGPLIQVISDRSAATVHTANRLYESWKDGVGFRRV